VSDYALTMRVFGHRCRNRDGVVEAGARIHVHKRDRVQELRRRICGGDWSYDQRRNCAEGAPAPRNLATGGPGRNCGHAVRALCIKIIKTPDGPQIYLCPYLSSGLRSKTISVPVATP
jgi:hypothetical protein